MIAYEELEKYLGPNVDEVLDELHRRNIEVADLIEALKVKDEPKYYIMGCNINGEMQYAVDIHNFTNNEDISVYMVAISEKGKLTDLITGTNITTREEYNNMKKSGKFDEIREISENGFVADELLPISSRVKYEILDELTKNYKRTSYRESFSKIRDEQGKKIVSQLPESFKR